MLCPVDIKIKTSHRERLVVREVWEQSRRRRGDLQSQRFRSQSKNDLQQEREMQRRQTQPCRSISQLQTERNGGMGRGGDEEDIRKKKRIRTFYGILSLSTLSLPLARSRSLLLLHYRSHHWNSGDSTWRFLSARHRQVGRFSLSHGGTWCTGMR